MTRRPSIRLKSGGFWYFDEPSTSIFTIEDIAHNLSKEPRFNGANDSDMAYSVAQHAVNASRIVTPDAAFEALHHDDGEFAYKDLTTWLKGLCPDYKRELARGEAVLADWHGLPREMSAVVKEADLDMLAMEKDALFAGNDREGFHHIVNRRVELAHLVDLEPWSPRRAYLEYMDRHRELEKLRPCRHRIVDRDDVSYCIDCGRAWQN